MDMAKVKNELVKILINKNVSGIIIPYEQYVAIRTVNSNDKNFILFAITDEVINTVFCNHLDKKPSQLALLNIKDPNIVKDIEEVVSQICDDYIGIECDWQDVPADYEPFGPSDWWKYGANNNSEF